jgi:hypothetical protein
MNPTFWKLSMGPGGSGEDFNTLLDVVDWVRRGIVLVHKNTRAKGTSTETQGEQFVQPEREGEYFYLCHGNQEPSILLLGQFVGPPNYLCDCGHGWAERPFRWIKTSKLAKKYDGPSKWWTPNHNSTFIRVPTDEWPMFESDILTPYFGFHLADFGVT